MNFSKIWVYFIIIALVLMLVLKGNYGYGLPHAISESAQGLSLEDSIARGRYALILSLAERISFIFSPALAEFAYPDVSVNQGKYFSIFPPGVAIFSLPFYILGNNWAGGQLVVGASQLIVSLLNGVLIYSIMKRIGAGKYTSILASTLFLLASNALPYSTLLSQHNLSTLFMLTLGFFCLSKEAKYRGVYAVVCYACSPFLDWPNLVLFFPFFSYIFWHEYVKQLFEYRVGLVKLKKLIVVLLLFCIPFLVYSVYNLATTNRPTQVAQLLPTKQKENVKKVYMKLPFRLEKIPQGLRVLLISYERGLFIFSPVFALSILGGLSLVKTQRTWVLLSFITIVGNMVLYSMFGDVWGGPSFGPRYLIPGTALLSIFTASAFAFWSRYLWFHLIFSLTSFYSLSIAALGAITTTIIPKSMEHASLYSFSILYPFSYLREHELGSFVYRTMLGRNITSEGYFLIILLVSASFYCYILFGAYSERGRV